MDNIDILLQKVKRIHFIGIGGAGMCPLAEILNKNGYILSGSDNNESDNLKRIRSLGIPVVLGQAAENITDDIEMVVFTAALLPTNPELCAAKEKGVPTFERSKLFGALTRLFDNCIGVCGTHGKTTTTSMLTQTLIQSGNNPSAIIGGKLPLTGTNGIVGDDDLIVCEACEFANTFLDLSPSVAVILNIDEDHLEYFKTVDNLIASFTKFIDITRDAVIYNGDDERTLIAVKNSNKEKNKEYISFGFSETNDWYPVNITYAHGAYPEFDLMNRNKFLGRVTLGVPGKHNILNAVAALAAAVYSGADMEKCLEAIKNFHGAGRRFEKLGSFNGADIIDDYAHHPAELEVTLNTAVKLKESGKYKRIWAVFQPFTFSRTYMLLEDFAKALKIADRVILTEIMGSREINTYDIHSEDLAALIPDCTKFDSFDEIAEYLAKNLEEGDVVFTLGCGDVYKIAKKLLNI